MDELDREILGELRADARISYRDLGARVGLSANATADRVRRLLRTGVIRGFTVLVDPVADAARPGLTVFIDVRLRPETDSDAFEAQALRLPGVTETAHVTGEYDYLLRARVADAAGLDQLLRRLKHEAGVAHSSTRLALRIAGR
ncbi:Lrp/AsnC family transcriptional regulator [Kitasatospora sp. NBC_01560]|uniref:Lrp/AsnC family transcriptional regulator n=1 Tax=Kitasatospora sp. NBC_01560 TaxID=2975965 RepID=UPI00386616FE